LDRNRFNAIARYAGEWLTEPLPQPVPIDELDHLVASSGVYVVQDALERVRYVGSVSRPGQARGVANRLREHLREPLKKMTWHCVWVLPLRDDTPREVVRRIEGAVGVDLAPISGRRLPAI
jgi:hypothetical protein